MSLDQFIRVYTRFCHADMSSQARQLDLAFAALNPDHSGVVSRVELHETLRRMSSAPLDDEMVDQVLEELEDGKGTISLASFTQWMARRYEQSLEDTSLIKDSVERAPEEMSDTEWMKQRYM
jgi:Ca2+-binding EF-hand superfamily protein|tara:strand:+ start:435 stop:800 length:366 start_codon:yes stop_codon:yes gene_type:complete